jgi:hypothetical protein
MEGQGPFSGAGFFIFHTVLAAPPGGALDIIADGIVPRNTQFLPAYTNFV